MSDDRRVFEFDNLEGADLLVDALYKGGTAGHAGDDPLNKVLPVGNQGGFRIAGGADPRDCELAVLYSSLSDPDWPDYLDVETGEFVYFGDNKTPGHALHDTPRGGNRLLRDSFEAAHRGDRQIVPPFFVFTKGAEGRDVQFRGLAVPGARGLSHTDDLVAVWKSKENQRFQNYKATFTILDVSQISRGWIEDLEQGDPLSNQCPEPFMTWVEEGVYQPLQASRSVEYRTRDQQTPTTSQNRRMVETVYEYFEDEPHSFERCAAEIARLMDRNIVDYDLTRPWVDGGRDAVGKYRIGTKDNPITVDFALEAKCYELSNGVGVRQTSRLISRLRYRQFGIFVTTSYVAQQAYREIKEDQHPVVIVAADDIVNILKKAGHGTVDHVEEWLHANFD